MIGTTAIQQNIFIYILLSTNLRQILKREKVASSKKNSLIFQTQTALRFSFSCWKNCLTPSYFWQFTKTTENKNKILQDKEQNMAKINYPTNQPTNTGSNKYLSSPQKGLQKALAKGDVFNALQNHSRVGTIQISGGRHCDREGACSVTQQMVLIILAPTLLDQISHADTNEDPFPYYAIC